MHSPTPIQFIVNAGLESSVALEQNKKDRRTKTD
jgi:hypothetical protein